MDSTPNEVIVNMVINGREQTLKVASNETLAEFLREKLRLTGTKIGCNQGECGACTVLINGEAVLSCITLAADCDGKAIVTIEGLEDKLTGALDPIQEAFLDNFGIQCGFCTPGMIISAKALLSKCPNPSEEEIKEGIQGNLCRCTGYQQIIESILAAAKIMREKLIWQRK